MYQMGWSGGMLASTKNLTLPHAIPNDSLGSTGKLGSFSSVVGSGSTVENTRAPPLTLETAFPMHRVLGKVEGTARMRGIRE